MSSMQAIDLKSNMFSGGLPINMFDYIPNLQWLQVSYNRFSANSHRLICSSENSIIPIKLDLGKNDFGGMFSIYLGL